MRNPENFELRYEEKPRAVGEEPEEELSSEVEKIYSEKFIEKLDDILGHEFESENGKERIVLREVVDNYLNKFSSEEFSQKSLEEKSEIQLKLLEDMVEKINKIPPDPWSINFQHAIERNALNCSNCASLTGLILEKVKEKANLQNIEYGFPYDHAIDIVTLSDGRVFYVDSRNNVVENLEINKNTKIEDKKGLKVYKVNELKGKIDYKIIPALPLKEGILISYLGNVKYSYRPAEGKLTDPVKGGPEKERREFQGGAKRVCQEEGLFEESKRQNLKKMLESIEGTKTLYAYIKSEEFKKEIKRWERNEEEIERAKRGLGEIFDSHKDGQERVKEIISIVESLLKSDLIDGKKIQRSLEDCSTIIEKGEFIKKVLSSLEPIIELRNKNLEAYKKIQEEIQKKFIGLEEILSYGLSEDKKLIHIHLVDVEEKEKGRVIIDRIKKDLKQLAKTIKEDEEFKKVETITATSWIVAKYPRTMEKLGFTLGDEISEEDRKKHYPGTPKDISIRRSSMKREKLLSEYLEK